MGYVETKQCIDSVIETVKNKRKIKIILINDNSPDPNISTLLFSYKLKFKNIQLINNIENYGFVKSVNIGMKLNDDTDKILLNSDTEVANNWFEKIQYQAYSDRQIATVCPLSNNATICSYPNFSLKENFGMHKNPTGENTKTMDSFFELANKKKKIITPTAVGFCMYIKNTVIKKIGLFDEKNFYHGYGEENEFSLRASENGYINIIALDTYVFHHGSVSFKKLDSLVQYKKRKRIAEKNLLKIYPDFHQIVNIYLKRNEIKSYLDNITWVRLEKITNEKILITDKKTINCNEDFRFICSITIKNKSYFNCKIKSIYQNDFITIEAEDGLEAIKKIKKIFKKNIIYDTTKIQFNNF